MSAARAGAGAMAAPSARPAMAPTTTRATVFTDYAPRLTTPELLAQAVARAASSLDRRTHRSLLRLRNGRENRDGEIVSHPRCRAGDNPLGCRPGRPPRKRGESREPVIHALAKAMDRRRSDYWVPAVRVPTKIAGHSSAARLVSRRRFSWVPGAGTTPES